MNKATLKATLEKYPRLYLEVLSLKRLGHWSRDWIVGRDTDITIEGYPRSGNSFARSAFQFAQEKEYKIATHVHSSAQVVRSAQLGVPTVVLVRDPKAACLSHVALSYQLEDRDMNEEVLAQAKVDLINYLRAYRRFYENILPVSEQIIIADFNRVISDYGEIIRRVNRLYQTNFRVYASSKESETEIFEKGGVHLSPNKKRDGIKAAIKRCYDLEELHAPLAAARAVYEEVLRLERAQTEKLSV